MSDAVVDLAGLDIDTTATDVSVADTTPVDDGQAVEAIQDGQQAIEQADGRKGPANIRQSIKSASEALPEQAAHFKELGNAYFREQAYKQHFPSPQEAGQAKQLIESIGGLEGISNLQQRDQQYQQQNEFLKTGNPDVLDDFAKDFPEGFAALAPHYLDRLQKVNPEAFSSAIIPHVIGMLESANLGSHLQAMLQETDPARSKQMLQQLASWYQTQSQNSKQFKTTQQRPGNDPYKQQREELDTQREQIFSEGVRAKVTSSVTPEMNKVVEDYSKRYKLNDTQKTRLQDAIAQHIYREMEGDENYKKQLGLRKSSKARTHDSVASFISSSFNGRLKDAAFKVATEIYGAPKGSPAASGNGVVKAGTPKTTATGGPLKISQRPPDSQLDMTKDPDGMLLIKGRGYTKDGRYVEWKR